LGGNLFQDPLSACHKKANQNLLATLFGTKQIVLVLVFPYLAVWFKVDSWNNIAYFPSLLLAT
jgi:hypothetical protein